jgi:hypothetical protein
VRVVAQSAAPHKTTGASVMPKGKGRARLLAAGFSKLYTLLGLHLALAATESQMNVGKLPTACQCSDMSEHAEAVD